MMMQLKAASNVYASIQGSWSLLLRGFQYHAYCVLSFAIFALLRTIYQRSYHMVIWKSKLNVHSLAIMLRMFSNERKRFQALPFILPWNRSNHWQLKFILAWKRYWHNVDFGIKYHDHQRSFQYETFWNKCWCLKPFHSEMIMNAYDVFMLRKTVNAFVVVMPKWEFIFKTFSCWN